MAVEPVLEKVGGGLWQLAAFLLGTLDERSWWKRAAARKAGWGGGGGAVGSSSRRKEKILGRKTPFVLDAFGRSVGSPAIRVARDAGGATVHGGLLVLTGVGKRIGTCEGGVAEGVFVL